MTSGVAATFEKSVEPWSPDPTPLLPIWRAAGESASRSAPGSRVHGGLFGNLPRCARSDVLQHQFPVRRLNRRARGSEPILGRGKPAHLSDLPSGRIVASRAATVVTATYDAALRSATGSRPMLRRSCRPRLRHSRPRARSLRPCCQHQYLHRRCCQRACSLLHPSSTSRLPRSPRRS